MVVDLTGIAALVTICSTACVSILHAIQDSRCTKINLCCLECDRNVPDVIEPTETNLNE